MSNAIFQNMISEWFPEGTEMSTEELIAINNHLKNDYVDELERDYEKRSDLEKQSYNKDNLDAFIDTMDDYDFREVSMAIKNGEFNNKAWTEPDWKWSTHVNKISQSSNDADAFDWKNRLTEGGLNNLYTTYDNRIQYDKQAFNDLGDLALRAINIGNWMNLDMPPQQYFDKKILGEAELSDPDEYTGYVDTKSLWQQPDPYGNLFQELGSYDSTERNRFTLNNIINQGYDPDNPKGPGHYEGWLSRAPAFTKTLETVPEFYLGYRLFEAPLITASLAKTARGMGMIKDKDGAMNVAMRPFHLKMMDWERNNNKSISGMYKRLYSKMKNAQYDEIRLKGFDKVYKQELRDAQYYTYSMLAPEYGFNRLEEAYPQLKENMWYQTAKIPAYIATMMFVPRTAWKLNRYAGIEKGGGRSTIKDLAWYINGGGNIDDYLIDVMHFSEDAVRKIPSNDQKFELAKITRGEFKQMERLAHNWEKLRTTNPKMYRESLQFMEETLTLRKDLGEMLAKQEGFVKADGTGDFDSLSQCVPELAETLDLGLDALLMSDSLRAQKMLVSKTNKIPAFAHISPQTLQNDYYRFMKDEADQRQTVKRMFDRLLPRLKAGADDAPSSVNKFLDYVQNFNEVEIGRLNSALSEVDDAKQLLEFRLEHDLFDMDDIDLFKMIDLDDPAQQADASVITDYLTKRQKFVKAFGADHIDDKKILRDLVDQGYSAENLPGGAGILKRFEGDSLPDQKSALETYADDSSNLFFGEFSKDLEKINDMWANTRARYESLREQGVTFSTADPEIGSAFEDIAAKLIREDQDFRAAFGLEGQAPSIQEFLTINMNRQLSRIAEQGSKDPVQAKATLKKLIEPTARAVDETPEQFLQNLTGVAWNDLQPSEIIDIIRQQDATFPITREFDLNLIHQFYSQLKRGARKNYGTPEGNEMADLARNFGLILEAGSKQMGADSFANAIRTHRETWVPLYKQGIGANLLKKNPDGTQAIAPQNIMKTFFNSDDPRGAFEAFDMIFKKDTDDVLYNDAKSLLKQGLAKHVLDGNMLNDETLVQLLHKNILTSDEAASLLTFMGSKSAALGRFKLKNASDRLVASVKAKREAGWAPNFNQRLYNNLMKIDSSNSPSLIFDSFKRGEFSANDVKFLLDKLGPGYEGGKQGLKNDMWIILSEAIQEKVKRRSGEIQLGTSGPGREWERLSHKGKEKAKSTYGWLQDKADIVSNPEADLRPKMKAPDENNFDKWWENNGSNYHNKFDGMISWQNEIDSSAMQDVLDEIGDVLEYLDPDHYANLKKVFSFGVLTDRASMGAGIAATGAIREMNPEQILSRIYSIQRQVVSPRYVAGEITVQTMRRKKQEMFKQLLTDKRTPQVVLDVLQGQEGIFNKPDTKAHFIRFFRNYMLIPSEVTDEEIWQAALDDREKYREEKE